MACLDRLIQPFRHLAPTRQRTVPFAAVVGEPAQSPLRQFKVDQRQRDLGPCFVRDQPLDARDLACLPWMEVMPADGVDHVMDQ